MDATSASPSWYRVDETRFGLPLSTAAAHRLRWMRLGLGVLYAVVLTRYPLTIRDAEPAAWLPAAVVGWVLVTTAPMLWRDERRRSVLVVLDFVAVAAVQVLTRDVLMSGVVPTAATVALGALPPVVTRRVGPLTVVLVGLVLAVQNPIETAVWLTGITGAVVLMMERARHEAALAWLQAARSAAYVNRLHRSARDDAARVAEAAERRRPVAHDLAGCIGSISALGQRLDRDGTTPLVVELAGRLDVALRSLQRHLQEATEVATSHLSAVVPQTGPPRFSVGWRLGGARLADVVEVARLAAIAGFVVLVFFLDEDLVHRGLALGLGVSAVAIWLPSRARGVADWWQVAVHLNDSVAICVGIALVGGLSGPVAPALVIHATLVSMRLGAERLRPVVATTAASILIVGATEGTLPGLLVAVWWVFTFLTGLTWFVELQRRIVTERRQIAMLESGRVNAQRARRGAARLARQLDGAFTEFVVEARDAGRECLQIAERVHQLDGRSSRVGGVLVGEAGHLLELLEDLEQRATTDLPPLVIERCQPGAVVAAAAGVAATQGRATIVDRSDGRTVLTDDHVIEVCVRNLVSNALRHRLRRPVLVTVDVGEHEWSVAVADDGPGLDAAEFQRLTHKYVQAAGDLNTGAYGLGLWIIRTSVERLGGRLTSSRSGGWFTVEITLPVAPPVLPSTSRAAVGRSSDE